MNLENSSMLTRRQRQVVTLAIQGYTIGEMANELGIAPHTVQLHLSGAYKNMGLGGSKKKSTLVITLKELLDRLERLEVAAKRAGWKI
jgi:DNA-binding NarL/FixJ family response regulator